MEASPRTRTGSILALNACIEASEDGALGYRRAAEDAKDATLRRLFLYHERQRAGFAWALKQRAQSLGAFPTDQGSLLAALHRELIDLRAVLATAKDHAILAECIRGDSHAERAYRDALSYPLEEATREVLEGQLAVVIRARLELERLRDAL